jgi:Zn-dependent alcohol dehydrogenase
LIQFPSLSALATRELATGERSERALTWVMGLECALLTGLTAVLLVAEVTTIDSAAVQASALLGLAAMGVQSVMVRLLMSGVASRRIWQPKGAGSILAGE